MTGLSCALRSPSQRRPAGSISSNVNLMNVRSAITAMLAITLLAPASAAAGTPESTVPRVTIAMLPPGTDIEAIAGAVPGIAPGLLGAGIGEVPSAQTYLDISQGNRLSEALYADSLPPIQVSGDRVPEPVWQRVRSRAADAPAEIVPGLLASTLHDHGIPVAAAAGTGSAALIAVDRGGGIARARGCEPGSCPGVTVVSTDLDGLATLAERVEGEDLLIALEQPPADRELLAAGILGAGFEHGDLTSDSTRMRGYVISTDLLPTILDRYGVAASEEQVSGRTIVTSGEQADPAAVVARGDRLLVVRDRRSAVLGVNLVIWIGLTLLAAAIWRRRGARIGLSLLAAAIALVPALLLLTAALAPSLTAERLLVGAAAPLLAAALLLAARALAPARPAYAAFAAAAALSIGAEAIDIVFGSPLTTLSVIGPNPALGVRFFGIGNELEATIGVLLMLGTGAALSALRPRAAPARIAAAIALVTIAAVLVFAPGRLGADVGAAITFPAGGAVAVIVALRLEPKRAALVIAAPLLAVALLVAIDLLTGGDAHLSRSVLGAGDAGDLADVVTRRIEAALNSFPSYAGSPFFIAALVAIAVGVALRRRIISLTRDDRAAQAGLAGAIAATLIGTLANDSAAQVLMVGTGLIAAFVGLAWAVRARSDDLG